MGVEDIKKRRQFLPLIGQVQLRFCFASTKETLQQILEGLETANGIQYITGKIGRLYYDIKDLEKKDDLTTKILTDLNSYRDDETPIDKRNVLNLESSKELMETLKVRAQLSPESKYQP